MFLYMYRENKKEYKTKHETRAKNHTRDKRKNFQTHSLHFTHYTSHKTRIQKNFEFQGPLKRPLFLRACGVR